MDTYSLIALLSALLMLGGALAALRQHNKKQQQELLARAVEESNLRQIELIRVQNPSQHDKQAYEFIEAERQKVWTNVSLQTSLAPKKIWQMSFDMIKQIAAIYHSDVENPQYQASIVDLLELNDRVIARILEAFDEFPLNKIRDFSIQDVLTYKEYFDKYSKFQFIDFVKKHKYLYDVGQYVWMGYNAINPWYWGRKAVFTASKEGTARYLLSTILAIVGEEAVLVYSKRYIRKQVSSVEKNIVFEMINMAMADDVVSQEEYEVILNFVLNNSRFDDRVKILLLKALQRKKPHRTVELPEGGYSEKEKKRLLTEVERVAKADKLGLLKKRDALKVLEESLEMTSGYRTQLDFVPHDEVHSMDLLQQNRRREEAILRLMVQAGSLAGTLPEALADYIVHRASSYPLPFDDTEQGAILHEARQPSSPDSLTDMIQQQADKKRSLSDVLDALLWYLPFTWEKEELYTHIVAALRMKKESEKILQKRLEKLLPSQKLVEKTSFVRLKSLFRLIRQDEQITALLPTGTTYRFTSSGEKAKKKDSHFWLCVTTERVIVLAATIIDKTIYNHHVEFSPELAIRIESGRLHDTYILQERDQEIRLESPLFHSTPLKKSLQQYLQAAELSSSSSDNQ
ncbi:hypothetical protein CSA56_12165 [candidate division KSB3 bacterium]|uniref:Uncharacterized protein n=1 Tax=candidate division KSB3 bacterium TaxID=2044937 RepID=A0A2G6KEU0_9BACT|nr:MAG: hypothetical protein CSA56_12165 [candidate division KSB3 bacterium]